MSNGTNVKLEKLEENEMAITTIMKEIKKIHPQEVVLVKIGQFYHVYGKDSYIISYLFNYKIQLIEENICMCGFPRKEYF